MTSGQRLGVVYSHRLRGVQNQGLVDGQNSLLQCQDNKVRIYFTSACVSLIEATTCSVRRLTHLAPAQDLGDALLALHHGGTAAGQVGQQRLVRLQQRSDVHHSGSNLVDVQHCNKTSHKM